MQNFAVEGRAAEPEEFLDENGNVPAEVMENYFKMLKPTAEISGYVKLWDNLWNDEFVESYQAMTGWGQDQIPFPGAAYIEMVKVLGRTNAIYSGVIPLGGREVRMGDITCPFLSVLGEKDHIVPIEAGPGRARQGRIDRQAGTRREVRPRRTLRGQVGPQGNPPPDVRLDPGPQRPRLTRLRETEFLTCTCCRADSVLSYDTVVRSSR